jgi:hypothetical protein
MYGSTAKGRKDVYAFSFQLWMGLAALALIHTSAYIAIYLELGKQNLLNFLSSFATLKGTVQRELRWVKICINRTGRINCIADKCNFPCPKGHHHESIINVPGGCSTF